ncbi:hypothetical protein DFH28DRAFT_1104118 [Melampsora americana]|nr:hypothetical protein DFH28DRAFT_1104118 [Melampsora americana]
MGGYVRCPTSLFKSTSYVVLRIVTDLKHKFPVIMHQVADIIELLGEYLKIRIDTISPFSDVSLNAIACMGKTPKDSLKIIECACSYSEFEAVEFVFGPVKYPFNGHFTCFTAEDIPQSAIDMKFPESHIFQSGYYVSLVNQGQYCSNYLFKYAGEDSFRASPHPSHIIFILSD